MVEFSYRLANALKMDIAEKIAFDRKAYFYPDLPKGFQITQFFRLIGTNGTFTINVNGEDKDISITEIHMEEDTAKQTKTVVEKTAAQKEKQAALEELAENVNLGKFIEKK